MTEGAPARFFFVTTNGHSASKWVAASLHRHPEIVCSHGPADFPLCLDHDREYTSGDMARIMADEHRKLVPIDRLLSELEDHGPAICFGNVHLFNLRQLRENVGANPPSRSFRVIDLVRHPVPFVRSGTANMLRQASTNPARLEYLKGVRARNESLYAEFAGRFALDLEDIATLAFMANAMTLKSLAINMGIEEVDARVTMESITRDREAFRSFVGSLTGGSVEPEPDYLDAVFQVGRVNVHSGGADSADIEGIYGGWTDWQRAFFDRVAALTGIADLYSGFGYEFPR